MTDKEYIKFSHHIKAAIITNRVGDDEKQTIKLYLKPYKTEQKRCPICGKKCSGYDSKAKERSWRAPDLNGYKVLFISSSNRIECPEHGVITQRVPWAEHKSRFTKTFEAEVAHAAL